MADATKKKPQIATASIITSVCAILIPFFIQNVAFYFQKPEILPFAGSLGMSLGFLGAFLGVSALIVIISNRSSLRGYTPALSGIVLGAWASYSWFCYFTWLINFQGK